MTRYDPRMSDAPIQPIRIGIIGGSGLGVALGSEQGDTRKLNTPFGSPSSPVVLTQWEGVDIAILQRHGIGHTLNPSAVPYRANIYALKSLGVTHILASGATGSLRDEIEPGHVVIADQVIDKTYKRANTFYEKAAVHVELAQPFCPVMRKWLLDTRKTAETDKRLTALDMVKVHGKGTYVCMEGPGFSTEAESHMHRAWGGDLIGMTCMPEAKLAREAEIAYALIALPTDYDCWKPHSPGIDGQALIAEIIGNLKRATENCVTLMKAALTDVSALQETRSPAHDALKLAIWSDKSKLNAAEVEHLKVLWGRHFD